MSAAETSNSVNAGSGAALAASLVKRGVARVEEFFLKPASAAPLAALRIGLALVLLAQVWLLRTSVADFFMGDGIVQGEIARALGSPDMPQLSWIIRALGFLHLSELTLVYALGALYVGALILMALGVVTRPAIIAAWALHWLFVNTGQTTAYGVDLYAHVFLFYLIWVPAGAAFSILPGRRGRGAPSSVARLGLRVMQLQLALTYFTSALEKSKGSQWWNGELMWRALTLPEYAQFNMSWLAWWPKLSTAIGLGALMLEMLYIVFIWPRRTRVVWAVAISSMHLGIAVFLGLGCFGFLMALLTPCLFLVSGEP